MKKSVKSIICLILAVVFLAVGLVGLLLPVIPQVPFFAVGFSFLMKGSERFSMWVRRNGFYRKYIRKWIRKNAVLARIMGESSKEDGDEEYKP